MYAPYNLRLNKQNKNVVIFSKEKTYNCCYDKATWREYTLYNEYIFDPVRDFRMEGFEVFLFFLQFLGNMTISVFFILTLNI